MSCVAKCHKTCRGDYFAGTLPAEASADVSLRWRDIFCRAKRNVPMSARLFSSEAYPERERADAWTDLVGGFGLATSARTPFGGHATAHARGERDGVFLMHFTAAPQTLTPRSGGGHEALLVFIGLEGDVVFTNAFGTNASGTNVAPAGRLLILPPRTDWQLASTTGMRGILLAVASGAFAGRLMHAPLPQQASLLPEPGLNGVLSRTIQDVATSLDQLADAEWQAVQSSLADMLMAALRSHAAVTGGATGTASQAALLHRICQTIERRLHQSDLSPGRIAQLEGISERYLQKVLENTAERTFSAYLRERRLQHCHADLASPTEARFSVSEIAFRRGFNDAAHFSRTFRERFGITPRDFRHQQTKRNPDASSPAEQRGWPRNALANARIQGHSAEATELRQTIGPSVAAHYVKADARSVHWGYFSRGLTPHTEISSGDTIIIETLSQHASDDPERMIDNDPGALDVFHWTATEKSVDRRGAGPMDASVFGRGAGEGFGVHICTGPIAIKGAEPGDVLEVRILDIVPRASCNLAYQGRVFGSSVAAWWGYHYGEMLSEPRKREVVTIYEIFADHDQPHARAVYSYRWQPQTDPSGTVHATYDYPGVLVQPDTIRRRHAVLDGVQIPLRPHFGVIAVAPHEIDLVDSVPPAYFGGNLDNWRLGKGAAVYLPVSVPGALLSVGDPHAAQGDGELAGTAIECSMTGTFQIVLHKRSDLEDSVLADVNYPLIETPDAWVLTGFSYPNYLAEFGAKGQSEVYAKSSLDLAMKDAFRKVRRFLMNTRGFSEDEAVALMSAAVDFGVTQVVDGNWGVHAIIDKSLFTHIE